MFVRENGATFLGWGIALAVVGLILALAVSDAINGVDLTVVGWILVAAGALCGVVGIIMVSMKPTSHRTIEEHRDVDVR